MKLSSKYKMLYNYGKKLEMDIDTIGIAQEYLTLFDSQDIHLNKGSESSRFIISLYTAAVFNSSPINKTLAIQLSGVSKNAFLKLANSFNIIINRNSKLSTQQNKCDTLKQLAIKFGCSDASPLAQKILQRFISNHLKQNFQYGETLLQSYYGIAILISVRKLELTIDEKKILKFINTDKKINMDYTMQAMKISGEELYHDLKDVTNLTPKRDSSIKDVTKHARVRLKKLPEHIALEKRTTCTKKLDTTEHNIEKDDFPCHEDIILKADNCKQNYDYNPYYLNNAPQPENLWKQYEEWKIRILKGI